jgi:hypothetical protein
MRGRPSSLRASFLLTRGLLPLTVAALSCSSSQPTTGAAPGVTLTPTIVVPKGIINQLMTISVSVYPSMTDGGSPITCTTNGLNTGQVTGTLLATSLVTTSSASGMCASGAARCFKLNALPQSSIPDVFAVTGFKDIAMTIPLAYGCATATLTPTTDGGDTTVSVNITLNPVQICGDGMVEAPETCDPPDGAACSSTCQTAPILLSTGSGAAGSITVTGVPGDKQDPSFLWPPGSDFFAFFTDKSDPGQTEISMRILDGSFTDTTSSVVTKTESIYIPDELATSSTAFPPPAEADDHKQPAAAQTGSGQNVLTHVVFADDSGGSYAIVLRTMDASLDAQQANPCPVSDSSAGESGALTSPAIAANGSDLFIAWQDDSGRIYGRTYTPATGGGCGTLGTQVQLSSGTTNSHVSLAGGVSVGKKPAGWVATWQNGTDIELRPITATGTFLAVNGDALAIQTGSHQANSPTVASIPSGLTNAGGFAVAWADVFASGAPTIFAERFGSGTTELDMTPSQVSVSANGGELTPVIAASGALGGSYVVAWVDSGGSQEVRARLLAGTAGSLATQSGTGTGYLENTIDATTGEFVVSDVYPATMSTRTRTSPTVAVGGSGYMAFGWADNTSSGAVGTVGIFGRQFPLPTE